MLYVFLVLALLASCALTWAASGFATLHALWQVPVFFAGSFLALVLLFLLVVLISCLFVDPKKLLEKPSGYFRFLLNEFCRLALALGGVHVNVTGLEKVPRDSRFLLVSNHRCAFDPLVFYSSMPWADLAFLSKKENFSIFVVAQIMRKVLCLPVDRNNDRESLKSILKAIQFIKDDKGEMVVSKLGEPLLEKIAQATDGAYIRSTNQSIGLDEIVRTINNMEKGDLAALRFEEFNEQFQYLIGAALVLLLLEFLLLDRRNPLLRRVNIFGTDTEK